MNEIRIVIVLEEDGMRIHDAILATLQDGQAIALSFDGVAFLTSPFIRALIGDLYEQFSQEHLRASLSLENISRDNSKIFKFVVEDVKLRLQNPQAYDDARAFALELA